MKWIVLVARTAVRRVVGMEFRDGRPRRGSKDVMRRSCSFELKLRVKRVLTIGVTDDDGECALPLIYPLPMQEIINHLSRCVGCL